MSHYENIQKQYVSLRKYIKTICLITKIYKNNMSHYENI